MAKKIDKRNNEKSYKDEGKFNKVVLNHNFIHDFEIINPLTIRYVKYWKEIKRRCMEGYWHEGKWMPGNLYFYINLCKIKLNKDEHSKTKIEGRPFLRDLEWIKSFVYQEARGFSGFQDDEECTCLEIVNKINNLKEEELNTWKDDYVLPKEAFKKDGSLKTYVKARDYLKKIHSKNLGKPLYQNEAQNVIDIECFDPNTLVLMNDFSYKKIKDIKIGEFVMGTNGPTKVKNKFSDKNEMYELKGRDGRTQIVSKGHLVHLKYNGIKKNFKVEDLLKKNNTDSFKARYQLYNTECIPFDEIDLKFDPYFIGLWLSDGRTKESSISMTDLEPLVYLSNLFNQPIRPDKPHNYKLQSYTIYCNNTKEMRKYGFIDNKHIPITYLQSSEKQRLQLLAGIIDGDGWLQHDTFYIGEPKKSLAESYVILAKSLGFFSSIHKRKTIWEVCIGGDVYKIPTKIKRKQARYKKKTRTYCKTGFDIKPLGVGDFVGIEVDDKDSLFLLHDFTVVHNCRGGGKSYYGGNAMVLHNFLMDGATDYDEYWKNKQEGNQMTSETLVGAIDAKYSKDLLDKVQLGMNSLVGKQSFQGRTIPSPLSKEFAGSWYSGKQFIKAKVDKKIGGQWESVGSGATIYHRSFKDDPHAGNGTRPSLACIEEVGFFNILTDALGAMKDTTYNGDVKFGSIYMFGTGGDMQGGSSEQAMEVFNNPSAYDCLCFQDEWEDTGDIGFFIPYEMGLNKFKDSEGNTIWNQAIKSVDNKRAKLEAGKSKKPLYDEMQNNPRVPSEAFLTINSNIFPVGELKEHLNWLRSNQHDGFVKGQCGELVFVMSDSGEPELKWKPDLKNKLTPTWFKMKKSDDATGCIQIWEHPKTVNGTIPYGFYIAGTDPYDQDQSVSTASLGSTFIYKSFHTDEGIYEWPVAEYTARPGTAKEHHENIRKLLMYYNAKDLYENERNTLKMHFEHKNSLHLLARTPTILKSTEGSKVQRQYGINMTAQIKDELEIYTRDWLLQDAGNGKLNLHKIYSIPLIQELIYYNRVGNYDRVIAFMLTICHKLMNHHIKIEQVREQIRTTDPFFQRAFSGNFYK